MRLIHYSDKPLRKVKSCAHPKQSFHAYKTPGLWVSVEGEDDWPSWCRSENFGLDRLNHATEIVLAPDANVKHLTNAFDIDCFTEEFGRVPKEYFGSCDLDWLAIRQRWQGLIIAPYCWERRMTDHSFWYYGWDCASGVIWDAVAVKELHVVEPLPIGRALDLIR